MDHKSDKTGHFWFSQTQHDLHFGPSAQINKGEVQTPHRHTFCKIDGEEMEYTLWSRTKEHNCAWDDMTYLGEGEAFPQ